MTRFTVAVGGDGYVFVVGVGVGVVEEGRGDAGYGG